MSSRAQLTPTPSSLLLQKPGIPRTSRGSDGDAMAPLTVPTAALVVLAVAAAATLAPQASAQISAPPLGAPAPSASPSSSLDCAAELRNLTPCLTYVERRSALTRPDKGCCGALAAVVAGDHAACLCALLAGDYGGARVDTVRALALPTICRVDAPPPRLCAALGMPVADPPGGAAAAAPTDPGSDGPSTTPATAAANGGPATRPYRYPVAALLHGCLIIILSTLLR